MPVPIFDTIADLIVERLEAGTYTGPYHISKVIRPNQKHGNAILEPFLCVVQLTDLTETEGSEYSEEGDNPFYRITAIYAAHTEVMQADDDPDPHDRLASYLVLDMAKAIATDPDEHWASWGGNAINSRWRPLVVNSDNGAIMAVGLMIEVDVSLSSVNPYTHRG